MSDFLQSTLRSIILTFVFTAANISCASLKANKEDFVDTPQLLQLEIGINKQEYKLEESIILKCNITNLGETTINLKPILFMDIEIHLKYRNEEGVLPFGPKVLLNELLRKEDVIKLNPRDSYSFIRTIDKRNYLIPNKVGQYELYVIYRNLMNELGGIKLWTGEVKSNTVMFEIK